MTRLVALPVLVALVACAGTPCAPPRLEATPARPFLFLVTGPGAAGTVWLFGTFHGAGAADVPAPATAALDAAQLFVGEVDALPPDGVRAAATLPRGQSLQTLLGDDAWYDLRDALTGVLADETLRRVRPWYALALLTGAAADLPAVSMDDALRRRARARGVALAFLETPAEQLALLADSVDAADVRQALADRRGMRCALSGLVAAYRAGDGDALREEVGDALAARLLLERNLRWVAHIEEALHARGAFVAVGVSHLVGAGSLPDLLAARGWRVER